MHMTPYRMAQAALRVACVLRSPGMQHWAAVLAQDMLCAPGYERPTGSRLQSAVERQGLPALPHAPELLVSESRFIAPHVAAAIQLAHPLAELSLQASPALRAAVSYVASFRWSENPSAAIRDDRDERWARWSAAKRGLAEEQRELERIRLEFAEPNVAMEAPHAEMAVFACAIQAGGWPDTEYTLCQVVGFPCVGDYRDSGVFRLDEQPAKLRPGELSNLGYIADVERQLTATARAAEVLFDHGTRERIEVLESITRTTREEVDPPQRVDGSRKPKSARGPYTKAEMNALLGEGEWRPLVRFAVQQGFNADGSIKLRNCDNARSSRTNEMLACHETIASEDASFPMLVASLFAEAFGGALEQLHHCTDDIAAAYRQLRCAHPEYSVVAIWDTEVGAVRYYTMYGHNFGLKAAVLSFNRHSQLLSWVARAWFGVCNAAYFDDVDTTEPTYCGSTGKLVLHRLAAMMGTPFAAEKDKPPALSHPFLGVVADLSNFKAGSAELRPKPERVEKIVAGIKKILRSGRLPSGVCATVCGKVEYTASSGASGRLGRAPLAALRAWQHRRGRRNDNEPIPEWVREALEFFVQLLPALPGRKFYFGKKRRKRAPVVVYTDAMYAAAARPPGKVGLVIYDPEDTVSYWRFGSAAVPASLLAKFRPREQYVGQLEVLAAVAAYTSRPDQLRGRDVIHFIDNSGALFGLAKGYSADVDSARLISVFHVVNAAVAANTWFEYVPSGANISDLPSRGEFELLRSAAYEGPRVPGPGEPRGALEFKVKWPPVGVWSGDLSHLFAKFSSGGARKRRARE